MSNNVIDIDDSLKYNDKKTLSGLKAVREARGLTISQLEDEVGIHHTILWSYENEGGIPDEYVARKIANALHCDKDILFKSIYYPEKNEIHEYVSHIDQRIFVHKGSDKSKSKFEQFVELVFYIIMFLISLAILRGLLGLL